jgi:hypothetical protein
MELGSPEISATDLELAHSLTCEATLGAAGLCIQNWVDTVETTGGELVVVLLVT